MAHSTPKPPPPSWIAFGLWPILAVGFVARLLALLRQDIVSVDGTTYIRLARSIFGGAHFETVQPPGYPALIGLATLFHPGDGVRPAQAVCLVTGTLLLWPFHTLARRLLPARAALIATAGLAVTPTAIRMSATTMSEAPYLLALILATFLLVARRPLAAGLLGGLASLIRPEGLFVIGGMAALSAWREIPTPGRVALPRAARQRAAALACAGLLAGGVLPALLYNHSQTGVWSLSRKGVNVASVNFWRRELTVEQLAGQADTSGVAQRLERHSTEIARDYPRGLWRHTQHLILTVGPPVLVASTVGLTLAPALGITLVPLLLLPLFPAITDHPRFVLPLAPYLWLLALLGLPRLARGRPAWERPALGLLLAGFAVVAVSEYRRLPRNEDGYFPELRAAGLSLKEVAPPDAIIFDRKPYAAFYADRKGQTIPLGNYNATLEAMNDYGGTYLIVADTVTPVFRPDLVPLLNDSFTMLNDPRLALVYIDERDPLRRVVIYQFVRPGLPLISEAQRRRAAELVRHIPHDPKRHGLHSDLLRRRNDFEGMCRECELLLVEEPDNWRAMLNLSLGLAYLDRDRPRALELLRRAREIKPGQPEIEAALRTTEAGTP